MLRYLIAFAALAARAQSPSSGETTIRTSVRLVQVNVVVQDKNGPVANLTKDDFILTDRGKPSPISVFSVTDSKADAKVAAALPQNSFSNYRAPAGGEAPNITIVLFDGLNTKFEDQAFAKRELIKFVGGVDPKDRIAIYTLNQKLRVLCDFTNTPEERRQALASFRNPTGAEMPMEGESATSQHQSLGPGDGGVGQFLEQSSRTVTDAGNLNRGRITLAAFSAIADHVADLPGRKTMVWVTGSLPFSLASAAGEFNRANLAVYPVDARGLVGIPGQLLSSAPAPINKRFSHPPPTPNFVPDGLQTMQELADLTGGRAFYNKNDVSGALRTALDDSAVSYTLGFYPDAESLDGRFHELRVEVARAGLNVRYRKGYMALKEQPASDQQDKRNLAAALESPIESSSIPLSAEIERRKGRLYVSVSMDAHRLQLAQEGAFSNGAINVFFVQQDETGKVLDSEEAAYDLHLTKEEYETYLRTGMPIRRFLELKASAKTLRILSIDRSNATVGSLIIPISQVK